MKRYLLIFGFSFTITFLLAQAPEAINYQAVIRGSNGLLLSNHSVNIRISLLEDNIAGDVVYSENHSTATNVLGIVNLAIGNGTVITGTFDSIDWGGSYHYIKIEVDTAGGTNYYHMGTSQLLSVPYALESKHSSSLTLTGEDGNKYKIKVDTAGNVVAEVIDTLPPIPTNGLVAWYPFNGNANDESGNGNHGTVNGATLANDRFGNPNSAYYFDGVNDNIFVPQSSTINYMRPWTMVAWINIASYPSYLSNIFWKSTDWPEWTGKLLFRIGSEGTLGSLYTGCDYCPETSSSGILQQNDWYFVSFSHDVQNVQVYINGDLNLNYSCTDPGCNTYELYIGCDPYFTNRFFHGEIDDIRLYNRSLSQDEILALYNESSQWNCGDTLVDNRDGQEYPTVQIGTQCWMAKNLNVGNLVYSLGGGQVQLNNSIIEKYCYNNDINNCGIYGGLYEWNEAMQYDTTPGVQGICLSGWHMPTETDWLDLINFLGGATIAGGKLKEAGTAHWEPPNTDATNESGFTGLPGGYRNGEDGNFYFLHTIGDHSISFQQDTENMWFWLLYSLSGDMQQYTATKEYGFTIRCIKND